MPSRSSSPCARRPRSSSPNAVKNSASPLRRTSSAAATEPPPPGSSHASVACTISPARGKSSTRTKRHHSTWPTTATFTGPVSHAGARVRYTGQMRIPPFERFYESHRDEIWAFLVRKLGRERAEDAFQETFLRALRAYPNLEHARHLRAWTYTIAGRVAIDELRRRRTTEELAAEPPVEDGRPGYAQIE